MGPRLRGGERKGDGKWPVGITMDLEGKELSNFIAFA